MFFWPTSSGGRQPVDGELRKGCIGRGAKGEHRDDRRGD